MMTRTASIGLDARLTYYRVGGINTYIRNLITALESMKNLPSLTVFHSRKAKETLSKTFRRANLWTPAHHRLERWALSAELLPYQLDIFHTTDFIPPLRGARRNVATVYDLAFLHYPQYLTPESRRYYNDQIVDAVQRADHILTISEASKNDIVSMLGVHPDKITVHLLAADPAFAPPDAVTVAHWRAALNLPASYFCFVGTFEPRKNIIGLLEGYSLMRAQIEDAPSLVLAGNRGWLFDETMARIETLGLRDIVYFRENIAQSALPTLYHEAEALVMPSFYEGFGLPALEAIACGTMPIVSARSSLPEVVGDVGIQIDPDDPATIAAALVRAHSEPEWRAAQEAAGLVHAQTFNWQTVAQTTLDVYQKVLR